MQNLGAHKFYITWRSTVCIIQGNLHAGPRVPANRINTTEIHRLYKCLLNITLDCMGNQCSLVLPLTLFSASTPSSNLTLWQMFHVVELLDINEKKPMR